MGRVRSTSILALRRVIHLRKQAGRSAVLVRLAGLTGLIQGDVDDTYLGAVGWRGHSHRPEITVGRTRREWLIGAQRSHRDDEPDPQRRHRLPAVEYTV